MEQPILFIIFIILTIIIIVPMIIAFTFGAPWIPTNKSGIDVMIREAHLKPGMHIIDPGCGDGRILYEAVRKTPGITARGYDLFFLAYAIAKFRSFFHKQVQIFYRDSRRADLSNVDVLFCFMIPDTLVALGKLWKKKLPKKAVVVSYAFLIKDWKIHKKIERVREKNQAPIFIYLLSDQK